MKADKLITSQEAATILGVTARTVRLWTESGVLTAWKTPGGHRRFRQSIVETLAGQLEGQDTEKTDAEIATVLVVEDDVQLANIYRLYLQGLGLPMRIETVHDGYQALIRIGKLEPRLVITDLHMPNIDGFHMIEKIRSELSLEQTEIVVITGLELEDIEMRGGVPESIRVYTKPLSLPTLGDIVRAALLPAANENAGSRHTGNRNS